MGSTTKNLVNYHSLKAGDMTTNLTSKVTNINRLDNIGIQCNFTGSPTGTLAVQVSADYNQDTFGNVTNAGNWVTPTGLSTVITAGSPSSPTYFDITQISAPWIRLVWTPNSSPAGTLDVYITGKMV